MLTADDITLVAVLLVGLIFVVAIVLGVAACKFSGDQRAQEDQAEADKVEYL